MKIDSKDIESKLPLLCWENGCIISKAADVTVPLKVELPQVFSLGMEDFEAMHQTWVRAIKSLPDYTIVHKQDWFWECGYEAVPHSESSLLGTASDRHFNGRRYLSHSCFIYVTLSSSKNISKTSTISALCTGNMVEEEKLDGSAVKAFLDSVTQFCSILASSGFNCTRITSDEMVGSPSRFGIIEQYLTLSLGVEKPVPLCDIVCTKTDTKIGDNYLSCYSLSDLSQLPAEVYTYSRHDSYSTDNTLFAVGYTHALGFELPFSHIYNQYFYLEPQKSVISRIEKRGREQQSLSGISRENAINKQFNDQYLNECVANSRRCVRAAANVLLWDKNYLTLLKKNTMVGTAMTSLDCTVNKTEVIVPQVFWGGIPGAASQFPSEMTFLTFLEQACCFIYNEGANENIGDGAGLRLCDRIFGVPLNIDISDYPLQRGWIDNRNKFILGPSGSGKSFFTNHMVRQYYESGAHIVIVDVGDSYQGLAKLIEEQTCGRDGFYCKYTEDNPISFNPFYVTDRVYTVEKREQIAALIFCLWKNENELITKAEETHISVAISGYIDKILSDGSFPCFDGFYDYLKDDFANYLREHDVQRDNFDLDALLQVLSPYYTDGMYHFLLNAKENIDLLDKRFIVFEIDSIKDHKTLFPVVTLILMDTFISKMRHPSLAMQRKMILIEEAWKAISKSGTAYFIKYLFKTVRKHFGEAVVVTQEVEDIIGNEIVRNTIVSNADCKILLDQRKYANKFSDIRNTLALSEKETAIALSVNRNIKTKNRSPYKEVFITLNGNFSSVYAVEVSKEEYMTYTTEKTEKERLLQAVKKCGSFSEALKQLCYS